VTITGLAYGLSAVVGAGIIVIGARFLLAPRAAAAGYGLPASPEPGSADPYLAVKGVRDITSGLFVFILIAARDPRVLGWLMLAATLIPVADSVIVIRHHGSRATAYGVPAPPPPSCSPPPACCSPYRREPRGWPPEPGKAPRNQPATAAAGPHKHTTAGRHDASY